MPTSSSTKSRAAKPAAVVVPAPAPPLGRPLRADAQRNYDLIVTAADAAFAEHGATASLDDIARRAGVGIGTLYRHFPPREALLAAILREGMNAIVARADELMHARSPTVGLSTWLDALVAHLTTYRGLSDMLAAASIESGLPLCQGCEAIAAAGAALVQRAQDAGEIDASADPQDVVMAAHAAAWVGEQMKDPDATSRLLTTLLAGLRADPHAASKKRSAIGNRRRHDVS
jgi:AcrR family transcriptional regulator